MDLPYLPTMARYNAWINESLYAACAKISDEERKRHRGAFFGSLHGTLNHIMVADLVWLGRFAGTPFVPRGLDQELHESFDELRAHRVELDALIVDWALTLTPADLESTLRYTTLANSERSCTLWKAATHFFNHQTHHRGQVTALLSQCGVDYGVTDLLVMPGILDA